MPRYFVQMSPSLNLTSATIASPKHHLRSPDFRASLVEVSNPNSYQYIFLASRSTLTFLIPYHYLVSSRFALKPPLYICTPPDTVIPIPSPGTSTPTSPLQTNPFYRLRRRRIVKISPRNVTQTRQMTIGEGSGWSVRRAAVRSGSHPTCSGQIFAFWTEAQLGSSVQIVFLFLIHVVEG